jgi:hypothetical protein
MRTTSAGTTRTCRVSYSACHVSNRHKNPTRRPEELLAHELCEEIRVTMAARPPAAHTTANQHDGHGGWAPATAMAAASSGVATAATVFRGPRLKTGIDRGEVLARLHTVTGRMTYRGRVGFAARAGAGACGCHLGRGMTAHLRRSGAAAAHTPCRGVHEPRATHTYTCCACGLVWQWPGEGP